MKQVNLNRRLLSAIDQLLSEATNGLTEFELMSRLDEHYHSLYPKPDLSNSLLLFQHHFYLRHALYSLQNHFAEQKTATLEITAVTIKKHLYIQSTSHLAMDTHDPLKSYYLDLSNLNKESETSVNQLINDFWMALNRFEQQPEALAILGLDGSESKQEQKQRYRELAQKHHPDKGGDAETFHQIKQAWTELKK